MSAMLTAIYARYSTDRQRETSVDDQINVCEKRSLSEGWSVIATYCDNGVSGSIPVGNRRRQRDKSITRTPGKPPGTLLAGILRCGICGAPYVAVNSTKYGCSHKHDRGTCDSHLIRRDATDTALIDAARNTLMSEEAIQAMQKAAREYLNEQKTDDTTQKRLQALEREIAKLTDAIAQMGLSDALRTRLVTTEAEKRELQDQIQELPEDLPMMIPRMVERYKALLDNLPEVFKGSPQTTRQALADLFGEVRIVQDGENHLC